MSEQVKFNLEITMPTRWARKFLEMLDCMRWCADVGASRTVAFRADGDGDFRPFSYKVDGKAIPHAPSSYWEKHDKEWNPDNVDRYAPQEPPPPYKTWRGVDFFFDAK